MKKMKTINKIAIFALVLGLAAGVICLVMGGTNADNWKKANSELRVAQGLYAENLGHTMETSAGDIINSIEINANHTVYVTTGAVDKPEVYYEDSFEGEVAAGIADGKLTITANQFTNKIFGVHWTWISFWWDSPKINITFPADYNLESLSIIVHSDSVYVENMAVENALYVKSTSGRSQVKNSSASEISVIAVSGSAYGENLTAGNILVQSSSGRSSAHRLNATGDITVTTTSGSSYLSEAAAGKIVSVKSSSGRSEAKVVTADEVYVNTTSGSSYAKDVMAASYLEVKSSSGRSDAERCNAPKMKVHTSSGSVYVDDCVANEYDLFSSSGSVRLNITDDIGLYRFELKTRSGSVRLNGDRKSDTYNDGDESKPKLIKATASSGSVKINID